MTRREPAAREDELRAAMGRLEAQNRELRRQLEEAQATLEAIGAGEVDALVVYTEEGERIYTLQGADYPYRVMVESIHEGAATVKIDGSILYCNRCLAELTRRSLEQVLGGSFFDFIPARERADFAGLIQTGSGGHARGEFHLTGSTGELIPVLITASSAMVEGPGVCLVVTDLSDQELAAARERELKESLARQRDEERLRIARDLHDGPLQELIGLSYEVHLLMTGQEPSPHTQDLEKIFRGLQSLIIELRDVSNELRPDHTVRFGLAKAIRYRAEEMQLKYPDLAIRLDLAEDGYVIPYQTRSALFYIFQECMNNIFRHAGATEVEARLILGDHSILLEVQDNGVGFQPPEHWVDLTRAGHLGLVGMRERAEAVGGSLRVLADGSPGVTIQVEAPCEVCDTSQVYESG